MDSISHSVGVSLRPSKMLKMLKKSNLKLSALVLDRGLGFSRGHQSDDVDEDEDEEEEEVKEDKDVNEEDKEEEDGNNKVIKCHTFLESQDQANMNEEEEEEKEEE